MRCRDNVNSVKYIAAVSRNKSRAAFYFQGAPGGEGGLIRVDKIFARAQPAGGYINSLIPGNIFPSLPAETALCGKFN